MDVKEEAYDKRKDFNYECYRVCRGRIRKSVE